MVVFQETEADEVIDGASLFSKRKSGNFILRDEPESSAMSSNGTQVNR